MIGSLLDEDALLTDIRLTSVSWLPAVNLEAEDSSERAKAVGSLTGDPKISRKFLSISVVCCACARASFSATPQG
jgi:hypothetical protein